MRIRNTLLALGAVVALALPVAVFGQTQSGYLGTADTFDILSVLQPAPPVGSARAELDRRIFRSTRRLVGTPRWDMATEDVNGAPPEMLRKFSCAAGLDLTPENAPRLAALVSRAGRDTGRETNVVKDADKRSRPFKFDKGAVCQPVKELGDSYDYPSGHATWGWTWATILAELLPDRADAILARGRAYGESRIVCGAHNASAVQASWLSASSTLAAVRATPEYQADFAAARAELEALRHTATVPDAARCQVEAGLVAEDIFAPKPH